MRLQKIPSAEVLRVFVDDSTALLTAKNKVLAEMAKKVMKKPREKESRKKASKLSVTENGKRRKEQDDCVVWLFGGRAAPMQQGMSDDGRQFGNAWSGLEDQSQEVLRVKEKARRKKCNVKFSLIKKNKAFQKNYMKVGVKKPLRAGMMPARTGEYMQWVWPQQ